MKSGSKKTVKSITKATSKMISINLFFLNIKKLIQRHEVPDVADRKFIYKSSTYRAIFLRKKNYYNYNSPDFQASSSSVYNGVATARLVPKQITLKVCLFKVYIILGSMISS